MKRIIAPIGRKNQGVEVTNLQDGLLLLRKQVIHTDQQFLENGQTREQQA